jgi:hypothetical protein
MESERKYNSSKGSSPSKISSQNSKTNSSPKNSSHSSSLPPIRRSPRKSVDNLSEIDTQEIASVIVHLKKIRKALIMRKKNLHISEIFRDEYNYPTFRVTIMEYEGLGLFEFKIFESSLCKKESVISGTVDVIFLKESAQIRDFLKRERHSKSLIYFNGYDPNNRNFDSASDWVAGAIWIRLSDLDQWTEGEYVFERVMNEIRPQISKIDERMSSVEGTINELNLRMSTIDQTLASIKELLTGLNNKHLYR